MNLRGRVHVVTGANSGIGREVQMTWASFEIYHKVTPPNALRTVCQSKCIYMILYAYIEELVGNVGCWLLLGSEMRTVQVFTTQG